MSDTSTQTPPVPPPAPPAPPAPSPAAVQRPDGVSEAEWTALGDPGKTALVRERERANAAERALAAARSSQPPKQESKKDEPKDPPKDPDKNETPDFAALMKKAVDEAMAPMLQRDQEREAAQAAERVFEEVQKVAKERFHDPTDALVQVDTTKLIDDSGKPDKAKITTALDDLLKRKPHLGRAVDDRRRAAPGSPLGGGVPTGSLEDRKKAYLDLMKAQ